MVKIAALEMVMIGVQMAWFYPHYLYFPIVMGVPPVIIDLHGIFHEVNQPAIGDPPFIETPHLL